ncbi:MAG: TonB-dependent receptor, partial [Tannerellaceae bacterium]|nr:TonB-dependent receptor [Tannerellaceae bacterium]
PEYTQSLSSILPLTTKDESDISKLGFKLMNVGPGGGGTQAWNRGSASFNFDYTDLQWYHTLTNPQQGEHWEKPYRNYAGQSLLRFKLGRDTYWKTFLSYSKTRFTHYEETPFSGMLRQLAYDEDNAYTASTFKTRLAGGFNLFAGIAWSLNNSKMDESVVANDRLRLEERELHLKAKAGKRFSSRYKLELGAESYLRRYGMQYRDSFTFDASIKHRINGLFLSHDFNLSQRLFLNLSSRLEYTSSNRSYAVLPRLALSYEWKRLTVSGVIGKYQQMTDNEYLIHNPFLPAEQNVQYLLGGYFTDKNRIYRVEVYHKTYDKLPTIRNGQYASAGSGYSRGIDVFLDRMFLKHWEYMIAYSYNDSQREYLDYPERAAPAFATRHNASLSLKYTNMQWRSIVGISNRFASGRPYHNPNKAGFMNDHTPVYHTLDISWTLLAHKKLIVYACFSNILNRQNVFGYAFSSLPDKHGRYEGLPLRQEQNQAFYIGCFLTLGKHVAYEASNF